MKYLLLSLLVVAAIGCGRNEFDVTTAQVNQHKNAHKPAGVHEAPLPPEAFTTGLKFKKGDRLPDGTIADRDTKLMAGPDGKGDGQNEAHK